MLGVNGCSYFEHPVPFEHFEYACANPIRIEKDGYVVLLVMPEKTA